MTIRTNIGRKTAQDERHGMIMDSIGKGNFFWSGKNNLVAGEDRLELRMHKMCLNNMNGVELGNNSRMTFFEDISIRWELMFSGDPAVMCWNLNCCPSYCNCMVKSLKSMRMGPRVCNH
jgi:hypothetical protein